MGLRVPSVLSPRSSLRHWRSWECHVLGNVIPVWIPFRIISRLFNFIYFPNFQVAVKKEEMCHYELQLGHYELQLGSQQDNTRKAQQKKERLIIEQRKLKRDPELQLHEQYEHVERLGRLRDQEFNMWLDRQKYLDFSYAEDLNKWNERLRADPEKSGPKPERQEANAVCYERAEEQFERAKEKVSAELKAAGFNARIEEYTTQLEEFYELIALNLQLEEFCDQEIQESQSKENEIEMKIRKLKNLIAEH